MMYRYVKDRSYTQTQTTAVGVINSDWSFVNRFIPAIFIFMGIFLISLVVYPFFSYKLNLYRWTKDDFVSPIPEVALAESKGFVSPVSVESLTANGQEVKIINNIDYNLINNWFPNTSVFAEDTNKVTHYNLSVPKLKVDHAIVTIGGKELGESLIQYPGTAFPGDYGTTVIFGHSVLPAFYNPKDYKTIFSLIPTLKKGDEIFLEFDGMKFTYLVENYFEVKPEEIDMLQQRFNRQMLRLVTCVPPGTYLRRGVIEAKLQSL